MTPVPDVPDGPGEDEVREVDTEELCTPVPSVGSCNTGSITGKENKVSFTNLLCTAENLVIADVPDSHPVQQPEMGSTDQTRGDSGQPAGLSEEDISSQLGPAVRHTGQEGAGPADDTEGVADTDGVGGDIVQCTHSPEGVCGVHGQAEKHWKPRKRWVKGKKTGLYKWRYDRVHYWKCIPPRPVVGDGLNSPHPTFLMLRSSAVMNEALVQPTKEGQNTNQTK